MGSCLRVMGRQNVAITVDILQVQCRIPAGIAIFMANRSQLRSIVSVMNGFIFENWPHHAARIDRITEAGLLDEFKEVLAEEKAERMPDPHEIGAMAHDVISDEAAIAASIDVCLRHGLSLWDEDLKREEIFNDE